MATLATTGTNGADTDGIRTKPVQTEFERSQIVLGSTNKNAGPAGTETGAEIKKADNFREQEYAITESCAMARVSAAVLAFNRLTGLEQRIFSDRIYRIMWAGEPVPVFLDLKAEADSWAAMASFDEIRAYLWAIWKYMPGGMRKRFLEWVRP